MKTDRELAQLGNDAGWNYSPRLIQPYMSKFVNLSDETQERLTAGAGAIRRDVIKSCISDIEAIHATDPGESRMRGWTIIRLQELLKSTGEER